MCYLSNIADLSSRAPPNQIFVGSNLARHCNNRSIIAVLIVQETLNALLCFASLHAGRPARRQLGEPSGAHSIARPLKIDSENPSRQSLVRELVTPD